MRSHSLHLAASLSLAMAVSNASGQVIWQQLLSEGQLIPGAEALTGFSASDTIRNNGFRSIDVSPNGNFSVTTNTDPSQGNSSFAGSYYAAGSDDRGATIKALRREGTFGGVEQRALSSNTIDNGGSLLYTSRHTEPDGRTGLWLDDTLLLATGDPITAGPLSGSFLDSFGWPTLAPDGSRTWISGYAATDGGPRVGEALFRGTSDFDILLQTGDDLGAGLTAGTNAINSNMAWSILGTNYLTKAEVSEDNLTDEAVILNGQVVPTVGGGILREADPIPAVAGGQPNETWAPGSLVAVNEAGDWAVSASARINGVGNTTRDMIVLNGEIVFADGDTVDGHTLSGLPAHLSLNDRGDLGFVWDNKAFVNGRIVAQVGDLIDSDGDSVGDKTLLNLFDVDLTNLPSGEGDGSPLTYLKGRVTGGLEVVLRNERPTLTGDYNGDGLVNAADYTIWRDTTGSQALLGADGDESNVVDAADRTAWADNYGVATGSSTAASVPEATAAALLLLATAGAAMRRSR